ncbi:Uncharacterized protein HZ326_10119 [Fusarium oxysporum f. sp. albedinis]|nr:Uncharacterized protein HZ326_10119 [Fusarium oxysporum f. sp. albedinis]
MLQITKGRIFTTFYPIPHLPHAIANAMLLPALEPFPGKVLFHSFPLTSSPSYLIQASIRGVAGTVLHCTVQ